VLTEALWGKVFHISCSR